MSTWHDDMNRPCPHRSSLLDSSQEIRDIKNRGDLIPGDSATPRTQAAQHVNKHIVFISLSLLFANVCCRVWSTDEGPPQKSRNHSNTVTTHSHRNLHDRHLLLAKQTHSSLCFCAMISLLNQREMQNGRGRHPPRRGGWGGGLLFVSCAVLNTSQTIVKSCVV